MTVRMAQTGIALVFLSLGGWALLAPASVLELAITPQYREDTFFTRFLMACFGAQAVLFGVVTLAVRYTARSFAVLGAALAPFLVFDWYFHAVVPVLNTVGLLDLAGNAMLLALCAAGWRAARRSEAGAGA